MTLGIASPYGAVVAADTRWTMEDGERLDLGGKLRAMAGGYVAATGHASHMLATLRLLPYLGHPGRDRAATVDGVQNVGRALAQRGVQVTRMDACYTVAAVEPTGWSVHAVTGRGDVEADLADGFIVSWPAGVTNTRRAWELLESRRRAARSLLALVRVAGWAARYGSDRCGTMSPDVELATIGPDGSHVLTAPAATVEAAGDDELMTMFEAGILPDPDAIETTIFAGGAL